MSMDWTMWLIVMVFAIGAISTIMPLTKLVKFRNRIRLPSGRNKRRQSMQDYIESSIKRENTKRANYKLIRRLKAAGNPYGIQIFHFRLIQISAPLTCGLLFFILYTIKNLLAGFPLPFPIFQFLGVVVTAYLAPGFILIYYVKRRRDILTAEIVKFSHRLVVCITESIPIYYAIRRAGRTSKVIKPFVDELLINWMNDPRNAIIHFGDQIGITEVLPLTNTLLASWNASDDKIIVLFDQQIRNIDNMRDFQEKKKIEGSPLRVTFIILIPFLASAVLVMLPWYRSFIEMMKGSF
ncbi:hypothetical protein [Paenibacillus sp. MMO-58]|uniref:hypothetical protein n=1 Tax=Paenibacillus sp. MMO-58 TaxID=3081290 RepID=UPI003019A195